MGEAFVARLGGDEFVIVARTADHAETERLARRTLALLEAPLQIDGHHVATAVSIGIAIAPGDGRDSGTLLKNADLALYRAKELGRRTFSFFEAALDERAQARRQLEADLREAVHEGQFSLHFQPLFDLADNRIGSFEALLRWRHPVRGLVSPVEFVPLAEETGLIVEIGAWVLREACAQAMTWPAHVRVAVNVSSVQFRRPGLGDVVLQALTQSGLAPARLELEITESIFLTLARLRAGLPRAGAIVRAITDIGHALGMEITAEGVEEDEQLAELRGHGCSSIQGYLFSRPVEAGAVMGLLGAAERRAA